MLASIIVVSIELFITLFDVVLWAFSSMLLLFGGLSVAYCPLTILFGMLVFLIGVESLEVVLKKKTWYFFLKIHAVQSFGQQFARNSVVDLGRLVLIMKHV